MSKQFLSVAMCTYNGEQYLQEQLDSIIAQTRLPNEVVVCDDGSTDATLQILDEFQETAPFPVRIYRNGTRLGPTKNFEKAIKLCSGNVIALSDQDDVWMPHKLERLEEVLKITQMLVTFFLTHWSLTKCSGFSVTQCGRGFHSRPANAGALNGDIN